MRFLAQFNNILVYVLLAAGFTKLMLSLWVDAAIIFAVVVLNGLLGFIQEGRAEKALDSIRNMLSAEARTLRGGETRMLPADGLVPGDVVLLELGQKTSAGPQARRGEEPAHRRGGADRRVRSGGQDHGRGRRQRHRRRPRMHDVLRTMVVSGRATGLVVATGSETELGRINQLLTDVSPLETPLLRQIKKFGYAITAVIGIISVLIFSYGHWLGHMSFVELFQAVTGIAVSLIPEGLPALITITLAIGVQRMAQRNAIIRDCPRSKLWLGVAHLLGQDGHADDDGDDGDLRRHRRGGLRDHRRGLCAGGRGQPGRKARRRGAGACADGAGLDALQRRRAFPGGGRLEGGGRSDRRRALSCSRPSSASTGRPSRRRLLASTRSRSSWSTSSWRRCTRPRTAVQALFVKGAPEVILEHCDRQQTAGGQPAPLDRAHFQQASDRLAAQGERVLGLAWLEAPQVKAGGLGPADLPKTLVLLGLVGLLDPPRKEAIEAVKECHGGGIRVTMITGDHKITAAAIAKMLGIGDGKTALTGAEIEEMDTATLQERVRDVDVFARASPEHKLRLVKAIQANKQIVAMTGDGVNDAPSLKKADIGVAMGIKGTEVTKEAAGMILADDNFASITAAVKEGRTVYNNIEKAMLFLLPTNVAQALVIAVAIFFGFTMPITAPQVLWVNMVTSVALGLVICFEPHEIDVMQRPPRAVDRSIVTGFGVWRIIFIGVALLAYTLIAFFRMKAEGASDALARTVAVNAITIGQAFYLLNSRYLIDSSLSLKAHLGNRYLPLGIVAVVILQLLFTYTTPFQAMFGNEAVPLWVWPWLLAGGLVFFLVVEAEKFVIRSSDSLRSAVTSVEAGA